MQLADRTTVCPPPPALVKPHTHPPAHPHTPLHSPPPPPQTWRTRGQGCSCCSCPLCPAHRPLQVLALPGCIFRLLCLRWDFPLTAPAMPPRLPLLSPCCPASLTAPNPAPLGTPHPHPCRASGRCRGDAGAAANFEPAAPGDGSIPVRARRPAGDDSAGGEACSLRASIGLPASPGRAARGTLFWRDACLDASWSARGIKPRCRHAKLTDPRFLQTASVRPACLFGLKVCLTATELVTQALTSAASSLWPPRRARCCATCHPRHGDRRSTACGHPPSEPPWQRSSCVGSGSSGLQGSSRASRRRGCGCCRCQFCSSSLQRQQGSATTGSQSRLQTLVVWRHPRQARQRREASQSSPGRKGKADSLPKPGRAPSLVVFADYMHHCLAHVGCMPTSHWLTATRIGGMWVQDHKGHELLTGEFTGRSLGQGPSELTILASIFHQVNSLEVN